AALHDLGCEVVKGDLNSAGAFRKSMPGCDGVFHIAGVYKVGIPESERRVMHETNVRGTELALDAALDARVPKIVYVSTANAFGNTGGKIVDETYRRPGHDFVSYYDETKYRAHLAAEHRIAKGAPIIIVQPGGVYGPGDHSLVGDIIERVRAGKLRMKIFPELGFNLVHVEDVADGILLAFDKGRVGQSYVLGGQIARMDEVMTVVARLSGRKPPGATLPVGIMKLAAPLGSIIGPLMGFPPNLGELISAGSGVTYWASDAKARNELGYSPRDLETGMRQLLALGT
ncbi:MAG: NAD-dependent epimerase/dehydratase family protein, partial [bacterium]